MHKQTQTYQSFQNNMLQNDYKKKYLGIDITMTYDPGSCKQVH